MHGGNIYGNEIEYEFSVNLNPLGPPKSVRDFVMTDQHPSAPIMLTTPIRQNAQEIKMSAFGRPHRNLPKTA